MSRLRLSLAVGAALLSAACYRVTVTATPTTASAASAAAPTVTRPWTHSFVYGLVPPQPIDVAPQCPGGNVQKVVTQHSFLNGLVSAITWQLYSPIQVDVWCAGGRSSSLGLPPALLGTPAPAAPADTVATR